MSRLFEFIGTLRISRHLHYSAVYIIGYLAAFKISQQDEIYSTSLILGLLLINILFFSSMIINNYYDDLIDKINNKGNTLNGKFISKKVYYILYMISVLISIILSYFISIPALIIAIVILITSHIYSAPPLRIKKIFLLNAALISFASVITLVLGVTVYSGEIFISYFPLKVYLFLFIVLFLAFNVKDINDYKGDKSHSVATLMTVLGFHKGKILIAILAMIAYFLVPLFLQSVEMIIPCMVCGVATLGIIMISKNKVNEGIVFGIMFILIGITAWINPFGF